MKYLLAALALLAATPAEAQLVPRQLNAADIATILGGAPLKLDADGGIGSFLLAGRSLNDHTADAINILDKGADPTGTLDSTAAWNAACSAVPASGGVITLPRGIYLASSAWSCNGKPIKVHGAGQGVTIIRPTHTGVAMTLVPGDINNRVTVEGLTLQAGGACATAGGIAITYPLNASWLQRTATVRDVEIVSSHAAAAGCNPASFTNGIALYGLWNAVVENVVTIGPAAFPAVTGTTGITWSRSYNLALERVTTYYANIGFDQLDYSEGLYITNPNMVSDNIGLNIENGPTQGLGYNGVSLTVEKAECAVTNVCLSINNYSRGYISHIRTQLNTPTAGNADIYLNDSVEFLIERNGFEGGASSAATGVVVTQATHPAGNNDIRDNQCLNLATCVSLGSGTTTNLVVGNTHFNGTNGGVFTDNGTGNVVSWMATDGLHVPGSQLALTGLVSSDYAGTHTPLTAAQWGARQGLYLGWGLTPGLGDADFVNSIGGGGGAFNFYTAPTVSGSAPVKVLSIDGSGNLTPSGRVTAPVLIVAQHTPASATEACTIGQTADDATYHYWCATANHWLRVAGSTW